MTGMEALMAGLNVANTISQHQAQRRRASAQAAELQASAAQAREEAAADADQLRRRNRQLLGRQRALFAKSGVKLEGTPLGVQSDTATQGEIDVESRLRRGDYVAETLLGRAAGVRSQMPSFPQLATRILNMPYVRKELI